MRIAQASSSENFTKYGTAPNQRRTGATASNPGGNMDGELNIINFKDPWEVVYRPIDESLAEKIATFFTRAVENGSHIGYSWSGNTQLFDAMKAKGITDPMKVDTLVNCDCATLAGAAIYFSGIKNDSLRALVTKKMDEVLMGTGAFNKLTTKEMVQGGKGLRRGDLLWREGHTGCALDTDASFLNVSLTNEGLVFTDANGKVIGLYPNDVIMEDLIVFQKFTLNDVNITAGKPGTRAAQLSRSIFKAGYKPLLPRLASVSNSSLVNISPFFGGGNDGTLYVNFYRASGNSGKVDCTIYVIYVRNEVI